MRLEVEYTSEGGHNLVARFSIGPRPVTVLETLDWWPATDHGYFKLLGDDGGIYILRHDVVSDQWELTAYEQVPPADVATDRALL